MSDPPPPDVGFGELAVANKAPGGTTHFNKYPMDMAIISQLHGMLDHMATLTHMSWPLIIEKLWLYLTMVDPTNRDKAHLHLAQILYALETWNND